MHFHDGEYEEACFLVKKWHYSHRIPSNVQFVGTWRESGGLFGDSGVAVAACMFSIPGTRWSEEVMELSRLVRTDNATVQLTGLISQTVKFARSRGADLIVSFADSTQGHHGGVYQASSWNYAGRREPTMDGCLINGKFIPGRSCNSKYGTRSPSKLQSMFPELQIEPHYDMGKYLYWKSTSKAGLKKAHRLGMQCLAYPKPDQAETL